MRDAEKFVFGLPEYDILLVPLSSISIYLLQSMSAELHPESPPLTSDALSFAPLKVDVPLRSISTLLALPVKATSEAPLKSTSMSLQVMRDVTVDVPDRSKLILLAFIVPFSLLAPLISTSKFVHFMFDLQVDVPFCDSSTFWAVMDGIWISEAPLSSVLKLVVLTGNSVENVAIPLRVILASRRL